ncbi:MAG: sortase [Ruminococcus sp.]
MKIKRGTYLMAAGTMLLLAALFLLLYNRNEDNQAEKVTSDILTELKAQMPELHYKEESSYPVSPSAEGKITSIYGVVPDLNNTGEVSSEPPAEPDIFAEYESPAEQSQTVVYYVNNIAYMGILYIPSLGLELPVMSDWSYPGLKAAPCRYTGSAEEGNLVIAAHNYRCHFGRISELDSGDEIIFTDGNGTVYRYSVVQSEIIGGKNAAAMQSDDENWDITLFTCTYSGASRVTVRAVLAE